MAMEVLHVYLKGKPIFDGSLSSRLVEEYSPYSEIKSFGYRSGPAQRDPLFRIHHEEEPAKYQYDQDSGYSIDALIDSAKTQAVALPEPLIEKVRREGRLITADEELYETLGRFPHIERIWQAQPLWGVAKFTQGKPVYEVTLATDARAPREVTDEMIRLSKYLAARYDGLVWDAAKGRFANPNQKKQNQFANADYDSFNPRTVRWRTIFGLHF